MPNVELPENTTIQVEYPNTDGGIVDVIVRPVTMKGLMFLDDVSAIERQVKEIMSRNAGKKKTIKDENGKDVLLTGVDALDKKDPDAIKLNVLFVKQMPYTIEARVVSWTLTRGNEIIEPTRENVETLDPEFVSGVVAKIIELDEKKSS